MFVHWWEYTVHQRELRSLCAQASEVVVKLRLKVTLTLYPRETEARHFRVSKKCTKISTAIFVTCILIGVGTKKFQIFDPYLFCIYLRLQI
jgi:hypothetical protein